MRVDTFVQRLKACRKGIVVNRFPGRVWGVALKMPRHPDANEHGFISLCSIPSPSWLTQQKIAFPPETLVQQDGQIVARGWKVILRILVTNGHLSRSKVNSWFGSSWEPKSA